MLTSAPPPCTFSSKSYHSSSINSIPVKGVDVSSPDASHSPYNLVNMILDSSSKGHPHIRLKVRELEAAAVKLNDILSGRRRGVLVRCRGIFDGCRGLPLKDRQLTVANDAG